MPAAGDVGRRCGEVAEWSSSESLPCVGEDPCRRGSAGLGEADGWVWALEPVLNGREFQGHPTVPLGRPIEQFEIWFVLFYMVKKEMERIDYLTFLKILLVINIILN